VAASALGSARRHLGVGGGVIGGGVGARRLGARSAASRIGSGGIGESSASASARRLVIGVIGGGISAAAWR